MSYLHNLDIDDDTNTRLLQIVQRHCKLALEHCKVNTLPARREAIRSEIASLRAKREALLKFFEEEGRV